MLGVSVDNLDAACERFESLNVNWKKRLTDGRMKNVAFVLDPDNYWVEIIQNEKYGDAHKIWNLAQWFDKTSNKYLLLTWISHDHSYCQSAEETKMLTSPECLPTLVISIYKIFVIQRIVTDGRSWSNHVTRFVDCEQMIGRVEDSSWSRWIPSPHVQICILWQSESRQLPSWRNQENPTKVPSKNIQKKRNDLAVHLSLRGSNARKPTMTWSRPNKIWISAWLVGIQPPCQHHKSSLESPQVRERRRRASMSLRHASHAGRVRSGWVENPEF